MPTQTVSVTCLLRDGNLTQTVVVRNWPSDDHRIHCSSQADAGALTTVEMPYSARIRSRRIEFSSGFAAGDAVREH